MPERIGECRVRVNNADVRFWPLIPGSTIAGATPPPPPPPPVAPGVPNVVVLPPAFGIFDIVIAFTDEPTTRTTIAAPVLLNQITNAPTVNSMPMIEEPGPTARICFAVPIPTGATQFNGMLRLTAARTTPAANATLDLPLRVDAATVANNLFVFFIVRPASTPPRTYAWAKLRVIEHGPAVVTPVAAATLTCKILRDNETFKKINRRIPLTTGADGFIGRAGRAVLGLPINWPLIFNIDSTGFVSRGHMIRLAAANISNNLTPFEPAVAAQMTRLTNAGLAARRIFLDAGHGVVYNHTARRSQEWFVAHKVQERIVHLLTTEHAVPVANIFRTRSAGFGLIAPNQIANAAAPDTNATRFVLELGVKRIRTNNATLGIKDISDLVLTTHNAANVAQPVPVADRTRLLTINAATLAAITTRLDASLAPARRVRANSIRWDAAADGYIFTREPIPTTPPAAAPPAATDHPFPITAADWFTLDTAMLRVLAERCARWSSGREIGSSSVNIPGQPNFTNSVIATLAAAGAVDYMRDWIMEYINVTPPHAYFNHGIKGWSPSARVAYMNATACDLYISLHENAGGGVGGMSLVSRGTGANTPPDDQIRLGKIFAKYLDGFDRGLRAGGITREIPGNAATLLQSGNTRRAIHAYLEMEFMDAVDPNAPTQYIYNRMVNGAFINDIARQIVNAIVEVLLNRQSDLDPVRLNSEFTLW